MEFTIQYLIRQSKLLTPEAVESFHEQRLLALKMASEVYADRAGSYNIDHEPTEEMEYGVVSLASEIFKRAKRMTGLLTPLRENNLREEDVKRIYDTCIDLINYASWQYALMSVAIATIEAENAPTWEEERVGPFGQQLTIEIEEHLKC